MRNILSRNKQAVNTEFDEGRTAVPRAPVRLPGTGFHSTARHRVAGDAQGRTEKPSPHHCGLTRMRGRVLTHLTDARLYASRAHAHISTLTIRDLSDVSGTTETGGLVGQAQAREHPLAAWSSDPYKAAFVKLLAERFRRPHRLVAVFAPLCPISEERGGICGLCLLDDAAFVKPLCVAVLLGEIGFAGLGDSSRRLESLGVPNFGA